MRRQMISLVALISALFISYGVTLTMAQPYTVDFSKAEQLLKDKQWKEVFAEIRTLSYKDSRAEKVIHPVLSYLRYVDDCEKVEEQQSYHEQLKCYNNLTNSFKQVPKKLPFTPEFIKYLNHTKSVANDKINIVQEEIQKEKAELEVERQSKIEKKRNCSLKSRLKMKNVKNVQFLKGRDRNKRRRHTETLLNGQRIMQNIEDRMSFANYVKP